MAFNSHKKLYEYKSVCIAHFTYASGFVCKNQYVTITLHMDLDSYVKICM